MRTLLLLLVAAFPTFAQTPLSFGESARPLNGPWMFHPGDNPAWARPDWDDSKWTPMELATTGARSAIQSFADFVPGWTARGFPDLTGYAWYRLNVRPADPAQDLWLLMPDAVDDAYELFVDGGLVGTFGDLRPGHEAAYGSRAMVFHMPRPGADGMLHLAVRLYMLPATPLTNPDSGGLHAPPVLGLTSTVQAMFAERRDGTVRNYIGGPILALPLTLFGLLALGLFLAGRDRKAYLWLALASLLNAFAHLFLTAVTLTFAVTSPPLLAVLLTVRALMSLLWLLFWVWWFGLEKRRYLWLSGIAITALDIAAACVTGPLVSGWVPPAAWISPLHLIETVTRFVLGGLLAATAIVGFRKQDREGWLALPALLALGVSMFTGEFVRFHIPVVFFPLGIQLTLASLANLTGFTVTIVLLIRRFMREIGAHARLQNEVANARQVQQVLVPNDLPRLDNYAVEAVYLPAQVVGGDFFQTLPLEDGSLLAVVGDVGGKGIPAAMVVALVVGTLRTAVEFTTAPAAVLGILNERLAGRMRSGFATCLVSRLSATGELSMANAGHMAPYLNGRELEMEPDLPVGLMRTVEYGEAHWQLKPGDGLTFLTDGVVEARRESGELFGFDRTKDIAGQPAHAIADAARAWGQDDDITVLTVRFEPARQAAA